jgi:hypothetical protein
MVWNRTRKEGAARRGAGGRGVRWRRAGTGAGRGDTDTQRVRRRGSGRRARLAIGFYIWFQWSLRRWCTTGLSGRVAGSNWSVRRTSLTHQPFSFTQVASKLLRIVGGEPLAVDWRRLSLTGEEEEE